MELKLSQKAIYFFFDEAPCYTIINQPPDGSPYDIIALKGGDTIEYLVNDQTTHIDILINGQFIDHTDKSNIDMVTDFVKNWNDSLEYISLKEYSKRHEADFLDVSKLEKLRFKFFTWNLAGMDINDVSVNDFKVLESYDLLFLAFQEFIPLTTKSSFKSSKSIDGTIDLFLSIFEGSYEVVKINKLFGMVSIVLVKPELRINITNIEAHSLGTGFMNYGNKGSVLTKLAFNDDYILYLLDCHLSTGESPQALVKRRNELYTINAKFQLANKSNGSIVVNDSEFFIDEEISKLDDFEINSEGTSLDLSDSEEDSFKTKQTDTSDTIATSLAMANLSNGLVNSDREKNIIFIGGDLNYRATSSKEKTFELIKNKDFGTLLEFDSMRIERNDFGIFQDFKESEIEFLPTYKFELGSKEPSKYDTERTPSYTDRILHSNSKYVKNLKYNSLPEFTLSDHKPVFADYILSIPLIDNEKRKRVISEFHTYRAKKVNDNTFKDQLVIEDVENTKIVPILQKSSIKVNLKNTSSTNAIYYNFITSKEDIVLKQKIDLDQDIPFEISPLKNIIPPASKQTVTFSCSLPIGATEFDKISILRINDTKDFFITVNFIARKSFFGSTLYDLSKGSNGGIPRPLYTLITFLSQNPSKDMFLDDHNQEIEREIMTVIDKDQEIPVGTPKSVVVDVLILLLKNLDGGIISSDLATFLFDSKPDLQLEDLLEQLPPLNVNILIYLTSFLRLCYENGVPMDILLDKFQCLLIDVPKTRRRDFLSNKVNYEKLRSNLLLKLIAS